MKELEPFQIPLYGRHIIEASAGTGKTYAISNLFLRLVLEKGVSVENILVVSFTEAATNELRYRIRQRLRDALKSFSDHTDDPFLKELSQRIEDRKKGIDRIRRTIRDLDRLNISTIHGFCRKVIMDNSFESGTLLDTKLIGDQELLKQEVIKDFWREHIYSESPLFIHFLKRNGFDLDTIPFFIDQYLIRPYIRLVPEKIEPADNTDTHKLESEYQNLIVELSELWLRDKDQILNRLRSSSSDKRGFNKKSIDNWSEQLETFLLSEGYGFESGKKKNKKDLSNVIKRFASVDSDHPFFKLIKRFFHVNKSLEAVYQQKLIFLRKKLIQYVERELGKRKLVKNILFFDDLIKLVHRAVLEQEVLVNALRNRFIAGMIDEFQDTDPIQYEIFKNIFDSEDRALYLIGDPKQSIYSFRGADIFTYIKASKETYSRYTLKENWRAHPKLIKAINKIFSSKQNPFFYKEILFLPSIPASQSDVKELRLNGVFEPVLKIWRFKIEGNKAGAKEKIAKAVASEISRLLELADKKELLIGDEPVKASDIAVLVRKNAEADLIQKELSSLRIPAIIYSSTDVFDSWECDELITVLKGIASYNRESYLKAALGTDIIGLKAEQIELLSEAEWESYIKRFQRYYELWKNSGFICMFRHFLNQEQVIPRLMRFEDGERRCTDLLHLMEIVHEAEKEHMLGIEGVIKWLDSQKKGSSSKAEEYQLRLESDESAVRVITIHRSKGLEFPIVFIPFAWDTIDERVFSKRPVIFHSLKDHAYVLDLGSKAQEKHTQLSLQEALAEDLRLIYVAVTRAKNCCYLVYEDKDSAKNNRRNKKQSAMSYLFDKDPAEIFSEMKGDVIVEDISEPEPKHRLTCREEGRLFCRSFSRQIDTSWRVTSFSSLISNAQYVEDVQDIDMIQFEEDEEEEEITPISQDIFSFPKGARAGTFFHDFLEHLDFKDSD
ncbi:MAG: exodeoxyribonuclease V subunit beta, partial [Deltaproteobacteria bacterium]